MTQYIAKGQIKTVPGSPKDSSGAFTIDTPTDAQLSIDGLLRKALVSIHRMIGILDQEIKDRKHDRNTIQNLKDCVSMLNDLKDKENDILESLTNEALTKIVEDEDA